MGKQYSLAFIRFCRENSMLKTGTKSGAQRGAATKWVVQNCGTFPTNVRNTKRIALKELCNTPEQTLPLSNVSRVDTLNPSNKINHPVIFLTISSSSHPWNVALGKGGRRKWTLPHRKTGQRYQLSVRFICVKQALAGQNDLCRVPSRIIGLISGAVLR